MSSYRVSSPSASRATGGGRDGRGAGGGYRCGPGPARHHRHHQPPARLHLIDNSFPRLGWR